MSSQPKKGAMFDMSSSFCDVLDRWPNGAGASTAPGFSDSIVLGSHST
jgi:hypothetical protein